MQLSKPLSHLIAPAAFGLLAACSSSGSSAGHAFFAPTVQEQEPNDAAFAAQGLGSLDDNDCLLIEGHASVSDTDGFAFIAAEDIEVRVELECSNLFADLDLCVWDPYLEEYVLCLLTPGDEYGSFTVAAGFEFHLVVDGFFGGSSYDLFIETHPAPFGFFSASPGASSALAPVSPTSEGQDLSGQDPERRDGFERYLSEAPQERPALVARAFQLPALPALPAAVLPIVQSPDRR